MHAPPVQLGFPLLHSLIKEHSLQASPSLETGAKTDPGLDDIENEADISMYGKEVRMQENWCSSSMAIHCPWYLLGEPVPFEVMDTGNF